MGTKKQSQWTLFLCIGSRRLSLCKEDDIDEIRNGIGNPDTGYRKEKIEKKRNSKGRILL
jgi:hypothetical protein